MDQVHVSLCSDQVGSILCLVHATDMDKIRLSCLVGGVNKIGDKSRLFSVILTAFRDWTKYFQNFLSMKS